MIKTSAPLDDIIRYAVLHSDPLHDTNNITPTSASVVGLARSKRAALSINALCDTPTIRVCAAPWTSVTDDNDLVSHLVSVYFTWYHPAYPCVIQDLFVEAMNSQQLGTTFCCPLLVNSILAIACVCVVSISFCSRADFFYSTFQTTLVCSKIPTTPAPGVNISWSMPCIYGEKLATSSGSPRCRLANRSRLREF